MPAVAEIRYVALKPLPIQAEDGERLTIDVGEEIPVELHGRWIDMAIEAGKVGVLPVEIGSAAALADEELADELQARGYKVIKAAATNKRR